MLEIKNLSYSVAENGQTKQILNNINLKFEDGKTYCITGHNGSGKSTLSKIIMGVISPSSGQIILNGQDITHLPSNERAQLGLAFAFQQPVRFKGLTVLDLLAVASGEKENVSSCCNYLSTVGLCARDYINRELDGKLSGGELKRIEIAITLARKATCNIFDEPEAGIDIFSFEALVDIFKKLKSTNATNIIVSHQERLMSSCDSIIVLSHGEVEAIGSPHKIIKTLSHQTCNRLRRSNS